MKQNIPYFFSLSGKKMSIKQLERTQKAVIFKRETSTNKKNDAKVDSLKKITMKSQTSRQLELLSHLSFFHGLLCHF